MITILHTNNLHGNLAVLPRLAALIARERERDPDALLLDAGDFGLGGSSADLGVQLLGRLGYDAIVPGNAENDIAEHRAAFARIGVPVVAANLAGGASDYPARPYLLRWICVRTLEEIHCNAEPAISVSSLTRKYAHYNIDILLSKAARRGKE